jgi:hypothetical protein
MSADWCVSNDGFSISGTHMKEDSRISEGIRWCFSCRKRVEFERIVKVPAGISYYGPSVEITCSACGTIDGDLFPGRIREWEEEYE